MILHGKKATMFPEAGEIISLMKKFFERLGGSLSGTEAVQQKNFSTHRKVLLI
jgi:hypothetical protein